MGNVYRNKRIVVTAGDERIFTRKRNVLAPGEMETVILKPDALAKIGNAEEIIVKLEDC